MRLRNDDGEWSAWRPFQHSLSWTLSPQSGERTVWAELYKGTMTVVSRDSIDLNAPVLGGLPAGVHFLYSIPEGRLTPTTVHLAPRNANPRSSALLSWSVSQDGDWFTVSPLSGSSLDSFSVTPGTFDPSSPGTYAGSIIVTVLHPPGTVGSPVVLPVTLQVLGTALQRVYLPNVRSKYPG